MAGPIAPADAAITTADLRRVRQYEPHDLTISVEAGMPWYELERLLAEHRQMVPLDPPFRSGATVGGVVAANCSGPRRRLFGTARDVVIGMTFATLEGKLVQSGGMVVKNVAGLDMAKLMIGSFGTLAAIAVVNFKLAPLPVGSRTFLCRFDTPEACFAARDGVLKSVLQPSAIDLLNPAAAELCGQPTRWLLALRAGGQANLLNRYSQELPGYESVEDEAEESFWNMVQEFTPRYLATHPNATVVRLRATLRGLQDCVSALDTPVVARAGTGIAYAHFPEPPSAIDGMIDFAPGSFRESRTLWPNPGSEFETMKRIKAMFDPNNLLNPGRLYGRL
jgi:glycolate oxidase FAD binding subunit